MGLRPSGAGTKGESVFKTEQMSTFGIRNRGFVKDSLGPSGTYEFIDGLMSWIIIFLALTVKCFQVSLAGSRDCLLNVF